jgi:hypothetical protein
MSDTDYINDHMGGFDSDGLPNFMNAPGFSDDGYGNTDYACYYLNNLGMGNIRELAYVVEEAVKLLPWVAEEGGTDQNSMLFGVADGWRGIHDVMQEASNTCTKDYFIFIDPKEEVLILVSVGHSSDYEFRISAKPFEIKDEVEWGRGYREALTTLNKGIERMGMGVDRAIQRLILSQQLAYLKHKRAIRDIRSELEDIKESGDKDATKLKLVELITETSRMDETCTEVNMEGVDILVEISTKDNLMPTFKIEPSDCEIYHLYEVSLKGDIISLHWMPNETLKEKYSLVNGAYSVPLLDLIKARKLSHFEHLYK